MKSARYVRVQRRSATRRPSDFPPRATHLREARDPCSFLLLGPARSPPTPLRASGRTDGRTGGGGHIISEVSVFSERDGIFGCGSCDFLFSPAVAGSVARARAPGGPSSWMRCGAHVSRDPRGARKQKSGKRRRRRRRLTSPTLSRGALRSRLSARASPRREKESSARETETGRREGRGPRRRWRDRRR